MGSIIKILPLSRISLFILSQTLLVFVAIAQPTLPPREVTVNSTQALHFGSFCLQNIGSSGGTVTVDWQGTRTSTGQVLLLETAPAYQAAIFEVNLCQGRNIVITYSATTILTGSNGGSLTLNIGPTEKGVSGTAFQVNTDCSFITQIRVGGTLTVGSNAANPGGNYTGSFSITFNQE
jgi:hypothetical protein